MNEYRNENYQPCFAYIPELDEIFEYDEMCDAGGQRDKELKNSSKMYFVGYGWQVYTYTEGNWTNNIKLAVGGGSDGVLHSIWKNR